MSVFAVARDAFAAWGLFSFLACLTLGVHVVRESVRQKRAEEEEFQREAADLYREAGQ